MVYLWERPPHISLPVVRLSQENWAPPSGYLPPKLPHHLLLLFVDIYIFQDTGGSFINFLSTFHFMSLSDQYYTTSSTIPCAWYTLFNRATNPSTWETIGFSHDQGDPPINDWGNAETTYACYDTFLVSLLCYFHLIITLILLLIPFFKPSLLTYLLTHLLRPPFFVSVFHHLSNDMVVFLLRSRHL